MREYITPNWHAVMVHLPLGLLSMGVLVEVMCLVMFRKSTLKVAGRWMILLGAIMSVPALTSGIYAYRDVIASDTTGSPDFDDKWVELLDADITLHVPLKITDTSSADTKTVMKKIGDKIKVKDFLASAPGKALYDHLLYNCIATGAIFLVIIIYLASSNKWRHNLYIPLLLILVASKGLMIYGSHHGGIAVYQYGAAIEPRVDEGVDIKPLTLQEKAKQYIPPAQMHVAFAGMILSFALVAFALSIRAITQGKPDIADNWYQSKTPTTGSKSSGAGAGTNAASASPSHSTSSTSVNPAPAFTPHLHATSSQGHGTIPVSSTSYPAAAQAKNAHPHDTPHTGVSRYWLLAALFTVGALVTGLWIINTWNGAGLCALFTGEKRKFYHTVLGVSILSLMLLLALITKVCKQSKWIISGISLVLVLVLSAQFYVGIVLMFDGPKPTPKSTGIFNILKFNVPDDK